MLFVCVWTPQICVFWGRSISYETRRSWLCERLISCVFPIYRWFFHAIIMYDLVCEWTLQMCFCGRLTAILMIVLDQSYEIRCSWFVEGWIHVLFLLSHEFCVRINYTYMCFCGRLMAILNYSPKSIFWNEA